MYICKDSDSYYCQPLHGGGSGVCLHFVNVYAVRGFVALLWMSVNKQNCATYERVWYVSKAQLFC